MPSLIKICLELVKVIRHTDTQLQLTVPHTTVSYNEAVGDKSCIFNRSVHYLQTAINVSTDKL